MSAINLRKDLELWCDFSERYFNSQTNRIQDQSGYGRQAKISGGATVGASSYREFEGTRFPDGSNAVSPVRHDEFIDPNTTDSEITTAMVVRIDDATPDGASLWTFGSEHKVRKDAEDSMFYIAYDENGTFNQVSSAISIPFGRYFFIATRLRENDVFQLYNSVTGMDSDDRSTEVIDSGSTKVASPSADFIGDIAMFGMWSRFITDAELDAVERLTAPRRANL